MATVNHIHSEADDNACVSVRILTLLCMLVGFRDIDDAGG